MHKHSLARKVARRHLRQAADRKAILDARLKMYGLERFVEGAWTKLYHGTTALFKQFDLSYVRKELVDQFYGDGVFLTPKKGVASQYADANRNMGFPREVIDDVKSANRFAGEFLENLVKNGRRAWDDIDYTQDHGVDLNIVGDIAEWIHGTKYDPSEGREDNGGGFVDIFSSDTGTPDYLFSDLETLGVDIFKYQPKIYTVVAKAQNVLVTESKAKARKARSKGFDAVIYDGNDLVSGVPEVAIFNPKQVKILKVEPVSTISGNDVDGPWNYT